MSIGLIGVIDGDRIRRGHDVTDKINLIVELVPLRKARDDPFEVMCVKIEMSTGYIYVTSPYCPQMRELFRRDGRKSYCPYQKNVPAPID